MLLSETRTAVGKCLECQVQHFVLLSVSSECLLCVVMMEKYFWDSPHLSVSNIVRQASNRRSHLRPTSQRRRIFMIQIQWRQ